MLLSCFYHDELDNYIKVYPAAIYMPSSALPGSHCLLSPLMRKDGCNTVRNLGPSHKWHSGPWQHPSKIYTWLKTNKACHLGKLNLQDIHISIPKTWFAQNQPCQWPCLAAPGSASPGLPTSARSFLLRSHITATLKARLRYGFTCKKIPSKPHYLTHNT